MSVAFKELSGSPIEEYGLDGFQARREFLIAWEDRDAFAAEVLGEASPSAGAGPVHYPGRPSVLAVRVRYEPLDPENPDTKTLVALSDDLNSYSNCFARATVDYRTTSTQDRADGPLPESGTQVSYRMLFSSQQEPITPRGWMWDDDPAMPVADDVHLAKRVPVTEHHATWHQVASPPWDAIRALQGKVNSQAFLGCAAETLLFEGAEAEKVFRAGGTDDGPTFAWRIHYVFRERSIKHGSQVFGWNHAYREEPAGFARATDGVTCLYDLGDFAVLFQST